MVFMSWSIFIGLFIFLLLLAIFCIRVFGLGIGKPVMLPTEINDDWDHDSMQFLEDMGIKFLKERERGKPFFPVELPKGFFVRKTDDKRRTEVVDNKGRVRIKIFSHRPFFGMNNTFMTIEKRYNIVFDLYKLQNEDILVANVLDGADKNKIVFFTKSIKINEKFEISSLEFGLKQEAWTWLGENHPDYENPQAYW
jgi:hypothetical protein